MQVNLKHLYLQMSKNEQAMDDYVDALLPHIQAVDCPLPQQSELAMIVASLCIASLSAKVDPEIMAETLILTPAHLNKILKKPCTITDALRFSAGGETIEREDLATLEGNKWLNDKVNLNAMHFPRF